MWQWLDIKILIKFPLEHCLLYTLLLLSLLDLLPEFEGCPLGQVQLGLHVSDLSLDLHSTILDCHSGRLFLLLLNGPLLIFKNPQNFTSKSVSCL